MRRKDPAAVSLGRKGGEASGRWGTPEQRRERARKAGLAGAQARIRNLTAEQRSEHARHMSAVRWGKKVSVKA